jgi:AcrR family transcriptional regulator
METKAAQLFEQVSELFFRYGVRSLTMDDIARHLGISKKTLYQFVTDKDDLVLKAMGLYMEKDHSIVEAIHAEATDALDELFRLIAYMNIRMQQMNPAILYDIQKYHPQAFRLFTDYKHRVIRQHVERNLREGLAQGLYRDNLNIPIVARLYVARIDVILDHEQFPPVEFDHRTVFIEHMRYHIRAIASERGIELMKERLQRMDSNNSII